MLHSLKKNLHKVTPSARAHRNAEIEDYRQRLLSIRKSLEYTCKQIDQVNKLWNGICAKQRLFAEKFYLSYPNKMEETFKLVQEFYTGTQTTYNYFIRSTITTRARTVTSSNEEENGMTFLKIQRQVLIYLEEIKAMEKKNNELDEITSEILRYQNKVDKITLKEKKEDVKNMKLCKNFEKLDKLKEEMNKLEFEISKEQKYVYEKHEKLFQAAFIGYWICHSKHIDILTNHLKNIEKFVTMEKDFLFHLNVTQLGGNEERIESDTRKSVNANKSNSSSSSSRQSSLSRKSRMDTSIHDSTPPTTRTLSTPTRINAQVVPTNIPISPTSDMIPNDGLGPSPSNASPTTTTDNLSMPTANNNSVGSKES